uniref:Uncharacterized protein n=1 Tax=Chrysotila carterae TaxID=13221 RepID=A0A7S4F049_CHRCT
MFTSRSIFVWMKKDVPCHSPFSSLPFSPPPSFLSSLPLRLCHLFALSSSLPLTSPSHLRFPPSLCSAGARCSSATSTQLAAWHSLLQRRGPRVSGKAVAAIDSIAPRERSAFIAQLHVFCRLRGAAPVLDEPDALREYLAHAGIGDL